MEMNELEMKSLVESTEKVSVDAVRELSELQLLLVGGGIEVSFN